MVDPERKAVKHGYGVASFEERRHPRFLLNLPIEYYLAKSKMKGMGPTDNACEGGLIIHLRQHFKAGQMMKLKLFFASGFSMDTIEMLSQVIWTKKSKAEYLCGVKFIHISPEDSNKLNVFLRDHYELSH